MNHLADIARKLTERHLEGVGDFRGQSHRRTGLRFVYDARGLCSEYFQKDGKEAAWQYGKQRLEERGMRIKAARTHAKLNLFTFDSCRIVVESSSNLRTCNAIEQFSVTNDDGLHAFHHSWITETLA